MVVSNTFKQDTSMERKTKLKEKKKKKKKKDTTFTVLIARLGSFACSRTSAKTWILFCFSLAASWLDS